jgi:ferredoxin, 2Fe-2S
VENAPVRNLSVSVFYDGKWHELRTYANEYRNLMMLIYDKVYIDGFGDCVGMGKCGTCLVEIVKSDYQLTSYNRNEDATLLKSGNAGKDVRLSCQIMVDEFIDGLKVNILG